MVDCRAFAISSMGRANAAERVRVIRDRGLSTPEVKRSSPEVVAARFPFMEKRKEAELLRLRRPATLSDQLTSNDILRVKKTRAAQMSRLSLRLRTQRIIAPWPLAH